MFIGKEHPLMRGSSEGVRVAVLFVGWLVAASHGYYKRVRGRSHNVEEHTSTNT